MDFYLILGLVVRLRQILFINKSSIYVLYYINVPILKFSSLIYLNLNQPLKLKIRRDQSYIDE